MTEYNMPLILTREKSSIPTHQEEAEIILAELSADRRETFSPREYVQARQQDLPRLTAIQIGFGYVAPGGRA